ncbi:MAG: copper-binding protein [Proteobacteria bacterium]|nr:copper-binding protein [Pseudomonadota bacterium]
MILKKSIRNVFANICAMFVLVIVTGGLAMQFADVAIAAQEETIVSHEGKATVKAIDMNHGIMKLAHGPIASLKWPAMTMDFKVKDKELLQKIKADDVITFTFIQSDSDYIVTRIQASK